MKISINPFSVPLGFTLSAVISIVDLPVSLSLKHQRRGFKSKRSQVPSFGGDCVGEVIYEAYVLHFFNMIFTYHKSSSCIRIIVILIFSPYTFLCFYIHKISSFLNVLKTLGKKYPALLTVIPLIAGILISYYFGINLRELNDWFFITALLVIAAFVIVAYNLFAKGELYYFTFIFLLLLFGILSFQYRYYKTDPDNITSLLAKENTHTGIPLNVTLRAVVSERPEVTDDRIRLLLDVVSVNDSSAHGTVLASIYKNKFKEETPARLNYGDVVEVKGKL